VGDYGCFEGAKEEEQGKKESASSSSGGCLLTKTGPGGQTEGRGGIIVFVEGADGKSLRKAKKKGKDLKGPRRERGFRDIA